MSLPRVLFILKRRHGYGAYGTWSYTPDGKPLPSGLSVSVEQMAYALDDLNIQNKVVQVIDNNCIDREVTQYKPTHVIIEAFWVVPEKFDILRKLHPTVKWIVRNHSKSDFLSHEGGMVGWALDYIKRGVTLACNSPEATQDFKELAITVGADPKYVVYLPNYYRVQRPSTSLTSVVWKILRWFGIYGRKPVYQDGFLNVGCFGAIRPLKNHLHQAMAAVRVADYLGLKLRFHVNATRVEGKAEPILTSLRQLFNRYPQHTLVELPWMDHEQFQKVIGQMDIVMQVSNSETFNIVAADAVANEVPVIVSEEVPWLDCEYDANPNSVTDIVVRMIHVLRGSGNGYLQRDQRTQLAEYSINSKWRWYQFLTGQRPYQLAVASE